MKWTVKAAAIRALERGGKVDPAELIEAAKDPKHPCHGDFTWDIKQAAVERWRDQARALIRQCKFEVLVDDVTTPVVQYVSTGTDDKLFMSVPKIRSLSKASAVMLAELASLHGAASRAYGIAIAKQNIVGVEVGVGLGVIRDQVAALKAGLEE